MNLRKNLMWLSVPAMLVSLSAMAHDPSMHAKDAEAPDCARMKEMDHSKMDMDDPVMQAMMKKCMKQMHGNGMQEGHGDGQGAHEHGGPGMAGKQGHADDGGGDTPQHEHAE